jgi:hypothetical protein
MSLRMRDADSSGLDAGFRIPVSRFRRRIRLEAGDRIRLLPIAEIRHGITRSPRATANGKRGENGRTDSGKCNRVATPAESWKLRAGSWKLGAGSWKLGAGSWKLEAGS